MAREPITPGLLIVTGASHTGKTSVIGELLTQAPAPTGYLSMDATLNGILIQPPGSIWEQIPLAYDLMQRQAETLLDQGWLVILESTFTYVPDRAAPEFHLSELQRFVEIAGSRQAPVAVVQLNVPREQLLERAEETDRLSPELIATTAELHATAALPEFTLRLDASAAAPAELAVRSLRALEAQAEPSL